MDTSRYRKRVIEGDGDHWYWRGGGSVRIEDEVLKPGKAAWVLFRDEKVLEGEVVVPGCGDKECVNPFHLKKIQRSEWARERVKQVLKGFGRGETNPRWSGGIGGKRFSMTKES